MVSLANPRWVSVCNNVGYLFLAAGAGAGIFTLFYPATVPTISTVVLTIMGVFLTYVANEARGNQATREIAAAHQAVTFANASAAEAKASAETERAARLEIEARLADRSLSEQDVERIIQAVSGYPEQEYQITTFWDLREPLDLAERIHHSLLRSNWRFIKPENGSFLLGGFEGIAIYAHPDSSQRCRDARAILGAVLDELGLSSVLKDSNGPVTDLLAINVGTKPN